MHEINQVAGEKAIHITGYEVSKHNNVIHPTAKLGHKSTVFLLMHIILTAGSKCILKVTAPCFLIGTEMKRFSPFSCLA